MRRDLPGTRGRLRRRPAGAGTAAAITSLVLAACSGGGTAGQGAEASRRLVSPTTLSPTATNPTATGDATSPNARVTVHVMPWRLPQPIGREVAIDLGTGTGRVLVAGGLVAGDASTAATYVLDPATGTIRDRSTMPVAVHDAAGGVIATRPTVVGGGNTAEQTVAQRWDGKTWTIHPPALPEARSDLSMVTTAHDWYVIGGYDGARPAEPDVLGFRRGRWHVLTQLIQPVRYAATVVAYGSIWVLGGERNGRFLDTVQRIDLSSGHVSVVAHLRRPVGEAAAVVLGGRILIVGGRTSASHLSRAMWWFDPTNLILRRAGRLPTPLADSAIVGDRQVAYLIGGETPDLSDRVLRLTLR